MRTGTQRLCQCRSLGVSTDLWALHQCRICCWSSFHGFWCDLHFNLCSPVCPHQAPALSSHLIPSAGRETCPANCQQLPRLYQSHIITENSTCHTLLEFPKAVYKALLWGTTSIFSVSATNLLNSPVKMTPPTPLPGENAQERTRGEQIILVLAQASSPAVIRFPGPHAAHVRHIHNPFSVEGLHSWSSRHRQKVEQDLQREVHHSVAFPGREDGIALRAELILQNAGENTGNHL